MTKPIEWSRYLGYWCDNCRTVWPYRPESGNCPDCRRVALRAAEVTVAPHDTNPRGSTR